MKLLEVGDVAGAVKCPPANVALHWPTLVAALQWRGIDAPEVRVGLAATVAIETAWRFKPLREFGDHPEYDTGPKAARLGNTPEADGDGQLYEGRGFLQITGRANYESYGHLLMVDLITHPDQALDPTVSARIAALYFQRRGVAKACLGQDWRAVRRLVNGGYNGWEEFKGCVDRLLAAASA